MKYKYLTGSQKPTFPHTQLITGICSWIGRWLFSPLRTMSPALRLYQTIQFRNYKLQSCLTQEALLKILDRELIRKSNFLEATTVTERLLSTNKINLERWRNSWSKPGSTKSWPIRRITSKILKRVSKTSVSSTKFCRQRAEWLRSNWISTWTKEN